MASKGRVAVLGLAVLGLTLQVWAGSSEELAKQSEDFAASTAGTKATATMIEEKVNKACVLLEKSGVSAFAKFKGQGSEFIFAGTYIWANDLDGKMIMHPIKPGMEGKPMIGLKDIKGKRFFADMIELVKTKGSGWVDYMWPKPGEKTPAQKISFVKGCTTPDGQKLLLGCGVYDMSPEEIDKLTSK